MNTPVETKTNMGTSSGGSSMNSSNMSAGFNSKQPYKDIKTAATEAFGTPDEIAEQIKKGAEQAQQKVKEYANVATSFAQENPLYIALGAAGLGLLVGAFLARRRA